MTTRFLDTNIFLRYLTGDDAQRAPDCLALFRAIEEGQSTVWTTDLVLAEIVFVLSSKRTYNLDRETIGGMLLPLIGLAGLKLPNKGLYERVFELYTSLPIDYIDAYHVALMERREEWEVYSYDAHFDLIPRIRRREPGMAERTE